MRCCPGLSGWPDIITRIFIKGRPEEIKYLEEIRYYAVGFEDGGSGHKPRNAGSLYKLEKERQQIFSLSLQRDYSPPDPFRLLTSGTIK